MNVKKELPWKRSGKEPEISGQLAHVFIEHYIAAILRKTSLLKHINRRKS